MTAERPDPFPADETLACHVAFAEVLQGERPMKWSDWAMPIYDSQCLTPPGLQVALWAVETLQRFLGAEFLRRPTAVLALNDLGLWPANDVPWVYANLFQFAAQLSLLDLPSTHLRRLVRNMKKQDMQFSDWVHLLLQLEMAGLGLRAGWQILFEPELGTGRRADVCLTSGPTRLLVETTAMWNSDREREADAFFLSMSRKVQDLAQQHAVLISGSLGDPLPPEIETQWLHEIEIAMRATAQDGVIRPVPGPAGGWLEVSKESTVSGTGNLEGALVETDVGSRLILRLKAKDKQAAGGGPVWVRLDEYAGLWQFTRLQRMTLQEKLDSLAPYLQEALVSFPHLAGVILSPAVLWAGNAPPEALSGWIERDGGTALRCTLLGHRVRESIIMAQAGLPDVGLGTFADWYMHEATWLDWALEQLHHPPFDALVQESPRESGR